MSLEIVYSHQLISHHRHTHVHYEMLYLLEGKIAMQIRGREYVAEAGDLVFLNQFEEHATRLLQSPYRRYYVLISPDELQAFQKDLHLLSVFRLHGGDFPYVLHTGEYKPRFDFYFSLLRESAEQEGGYRETRLAALMTLILTEARQIQPSMFQAVLESSFLPIQDILDEMDRNFSEEFSLEGLSARHHVSPGCLSSHFRRHVGMSPMQYITLSRLTHAKRLLLQTDQSIQQIALQCGFMDQSNFARRFRQQFQCTPLQFRRQYKEKPAFPMKR